MVMTSMGSLSRADLRAMVVRALGAPVKTGTGDASTDGTLVHANVLDDKPDNYYKGAWVYFPGSPAATPQARQIQSSDQSAASVTFIPTDGTNLGAAEAYEILPFSPDEMHAAMQKAADELYEQFRLGVPTKYEHWMTGSPVFNPTLSYWEVDATADYNLYGWVPATVVETPVYPAMSEANKGVNTTSPTGLAYTQLSAAIGTLTQSEMRASLLADLAGTSVKVHAIARGGDASSIRAQIVDEAGNVLVSTGYADASDWDLISSDAVLVPETSWMNKVRIDKAVGANAADIAAVWLEGGPPLTRYPMPANLFPSGPDKVRLRWAPLDTSNAKVRMTGPLVDAPSWHTEHYIPHDHVLQNLPIDGEDLEFQTLVFDRAPENGYVIECIGEAPVQLISTADTDSVLMTRWGGQILGVGAALVLLRNKYQVASTSMQNRMNPQISRLEAQYDGLRLKGDDRRQVSLEPGW